MKCNNCGSDKAYVMRFTRFGESCNHCADFKAKGSPDVYFRSPYLDTNLVDYKNINQKDGVWIESKRHKKEIMNSLNVVERGDRRHGARNHDHILSRSEQNQFKYRF